MVNDPVVVAVPAVTLTVLGLLSERLFALPNDPAAVVPRFSVFDPLSDTPSPSPESDICGDGVPLNGTVREPEDGPGADGA
jgi:hypothetical protein